MNFLFLNETSDLAIFQRDLAEDFRFFLDHLKMAIKVDSSDFGGTFLKSHKSTLGQN